MSTRTGNGRAKPSHGNGQAPNGVSNRLNVPFAPEQFGEIQSEARARGISSAQLVRLAVSQYTAHAGAHTASFPAYAGGPPGSGPPKLPRSKHKRQALFLEAVREFFSVEQALDITGIPEAEVDRWASEEGFAARVDRAMWCFILGIERILLAIGRGETKKGVASALLAFLQAHHAEYGRVKAEIVQRTIKPLIGQLYQIAVHEAGEKVGARILDRMENRVDRKLKDFT